MEEVGESEKQRLSSFESHAGRWLLGNMETTPDVKPTKTFPTGAPFPARHDTPDVKPTKPFPTGSPSPAGHAFQVPLFNRFEVLFAQEELHKTEGARGGAGVRTRP